MSFYAGQKPGADKLYALSYATTYVPALTAVTTDPNLGADGTITGWFRRNGLWISGGVLIHFSGAGVSAGSGAYTVSLPIDADTSIMPASGTIGAAPIIGSGFIRDDDTFANSDIIVASLRTASTFRLLGADGQINDVNPFTWAGEDRISINFAYVADPADLPFGT